MGIKTFVAKLLARRAHKQIQYWSLQPADTQKKVFKTLLSSAQNTLFGEDHDLRLVQNYQEYREAVPIRDYEQIKPYLQRIFDGEDNVLWPDKPLYFAKTSGTTSGIKYIPISKQSMPYHIEGARNALLSYVHRTGDASFLDGKMIFLSGSPVLDEKSGIPVGRLSGIVNYHVPAYLRTNQLPSYSTNSIEDWETKLDKIVEETIGQDMRLISGIPPWVQMYFDRIQEKSGKKIGQLFPHFNLLVHGGVNFEPYRNKLLESIGRPINLLETFPASEGFFAYQDGAVENGLLLLLNAGIYYEFVPAAEIHSTKPARLSISEVELGVNYAMIISTNAGLWAYNIGDIVKFVSKNPYRLIVTGRIKHYISAFGEHVIGEEVEQSLSETAYSEGVKIIEFTVAPQVNPESGETPYHEWFIEFENLPQSLEQFRLELDRKMQQRNLYYRDLIEGNILQPLHITIVEKAGFINYMKSVGKLGGQNKLPRLSNDRKIADSLSPYVVRKLNPALSR